MNVRQIRSILALVVVVSFTLLTMALAIFPLLPGRDVELESYSNFFVKMISGYSGLVGVILGYYFGKGAATPEDAKGEK